MKRRVRFLSMIVLTGCIFMSGTSRMSSQWIRVGPGDSRSTNILATLGSDLYAGSGTGLYRSTDFGATWTLRMANWSEMHVYSLLAIPDGRSVGRLFAGTLSGMFVSVDSGMSWTAINNGLWGGADYCLTNMDTILFAGTERAGVFRSTDNGGSWRMITNNLPGYPDYYSFVVNTLAVVDSHLFAGLHGPGVFLSTDSGATWAAANAGFTGQYGRYVSTLGVFGTRLFAVTGSGTFRSTNYGRSWTLIASNWPACFAYYGTTLFAGGPGGVYVSADSGTTWAQMSSGLVYDPPAPFSVIGLAVLDPYLFAVTGSNCVFRRPLSEMITDVKGDSPAFPWCFALAQNYPNPFNPSTTIRYALPHRSRVSLMVYNLLGQCVRTLASGEEDAGIHEVKFDGEGLASGVYFYRLDASGYSQSRKLMLLK